MLTADKQVNFPTVSCSIGRLVGLFDTKVIQSNSKGKRLKVMNKWSDKFLEKVVNSYIAVLKNILTKENPWGIGLETELPYSKDVIRIAVALVLLTWDLDDDENRANLEVSFLELESFIPAEEYQVVKTFETLILSSGQIAKSSDKEELEKLVRTVANSPGDRAMEIVENISRKKKERVKEIVALRSILGLPSIEEFENILPK